LKHIGAKNTKTKVQIVISCAFNNKKLVHFVGIIIVYLPEFLGEAQMSVYSTQIAGDRTLKSLFSNHTFRYVQLFTEVEKSYEESPQRQVPAGHKHFCT
jgi:hypothetical protein